MASDFGDSLLSFSVELYKKLKNEGNGAGNIICSPFSIAAALSMTLAGARHDTAKQVSSALHVQHDTVHGHFADFLSKLPAYAPDVVLHVANRLYSEQTYKTLEEFTRLLEKSYGTTIENVDFRRDFDKARLRVNAWVEEATRSKIKDLLAKGTVDASTSLIIVNAVYFKGLWHDQFNPMRTSQQEFHETTDRSKMVDMMYQKKRFRMSRHPDVKVSCPRNSVQGQQDVDGHPASGRSRRACWSRGGFDCLQLDGDPPGPVLPGDIELTLPKFKLEQAVGLKKVLATMGVEDLFDPSKCDLSGISADKDLVVSDVIHKAFVEVNEEGTEAAAATAVMMVKYCLSFPTRFIVDHPFLFLIRSHDPDVVLFLGSVRQI
ncbi:hypothetical protein HPB47_024568 [Ixodes persulcatus]|uniref:Uncharacterized protein n=1 Tax=Ixodes persulcatus TaxID=34615 RepID=A0AC60Q437_IXOPE|nr:hypothetical protein HPB47_024568 [Ixodes persulcatus]